MSNNVVVVATKSHSSSSSCCCPVDAETIAVVQTLPQQGEGGEGEHDGLMMRVSSTQPQPSQFFLRYEEESSSGSNTGSIGEHKTTETQSFLHLLKGYVGPGCLSLPWAVSQLGGGLTGSLVIFVVALWTSFNSYSVVRLKLHMQREQQQNNSDYNYSSSSLQTITYPQVSRWLYGRTMEQYTAGCVCVQQLSVCTVFLSFVGANLQSVLQEVVSVDVSHFAVITVAMPACLALSCLPDLKALAPVTAVGTFLLFVGLGLLMSVVALEWNDRPSSDTVTVQWSAVPLAVCAILYSFEGICLILPVESSMARPRNFTPVFVSAMTSSASIFCLVAGLSVAAFGNVTNGSITAFLLEKYYNVQHLQSLLLIANAAVSFSVLVTYPLQLFPCLELIGPIFASSSSSNNGSAALTERGGRANFVGLSEEDEEALPTEDDEDDDDETVMLDSPQARVFLVLLTYVAAVSVPNVESLISLSGALAGSSTALLIPPLLQIAYAKQKGSFEGLVLSYLLFAAGFVFMLIGTVASIVDIVKIYAGG